MKLRKLPPNYRKFVLRAFNIEIAELAWLCTSLYPQPTPWFLIICFTIRDDTAFALLNNWREKEMANNKEPSQRQLRVGQEIRRIIAAEIERGEVRNLHDINTMVTITEVHVSPDLKYANAYVMTLNGDCLDEVMEALKLAAGHFRKSVGRNTNLRYVPEIVFRVDDTFEAVDKIEKLLHDPKVQQDLKNNE